MSAGSDKSQDSAVQTVREVLVDAGLLPTPLEEIDGYSVAFVGETELTGVAVVYTDEDRFVFYVEFNEPLPVERLAQAAEFLTRANFGLTIGNFELDYDTARARFKSSLDFYGVELAPSLVRRAILAAMDAVEIYGPALKMVANGKCSPLEAYQRAEEGMEKE